MSGSDVRATSEKVISSKIIKKSGPLGKITGYFGEFSKSITGIFGGCVMLVIGFGIIIAGVVAVSKDSKVIEKLSLQTIEEAADKDELVKVEGTATVSLPASLQYSTNDFYGIEQQQTFDKDTLYLEVEYQIFEQVKTTTTETRTSVQNGEQVEEQVEKTEITEEWVTKKNAETFGEFSLGDIEIELKNISKRFDFSTETIENVVIPGTSSAQVYENPSAQVGDTKMIVNYVPVDADLIVIGNIHNKKMDGGDVFMISNLSDTELVAKLKGEENAARWGLRFVAWLLLTAGFSAFVAPILVLTKLVPGLNKIVGCATSLASAALSAAIVLLVTALVTYWWLIILCSVLLVAVIGGVGIMSLMRKS